MRFARRLPYKSPLVMELLRGAFAAPDFSTAAWVKNTVETIWHHRAKRRAGEGFGGVRAEARAELVIAGTNPPSGNRRCRMAQALRTKRQYC